MEALQGGRVSGCKRRSRRLPTSLAWLPRHAREQMERREIPAAVVDAVLGKPEQVTVEDQGRRAHQSRFDLGGRIFLVRAIVDASVDPAVVVTVYRTSRIGKYWRAE